MNIVRPETLAKPSGYNHGVVASGRILAIAGQVAWNRDGLIVSSSFPLQFAKALENVLEVVRYAGGVPEDIISLTIFVTAKDEYLAALDPIGAEYRRIMGRHYPAMTLVEVKGLIEPGAKVEIQGLAVL